MASSLEFLFEVDAKIDGLLDAVKAIGQTQRGLADLASASAKAEHATEKVANASHHAAGAHGKHGHAIWQLGHHYEDAKNSINEFAKAIGLVLAYEAVEKIVDKVKELGEEIVKSGAKAEQTHLSFEMLFGKKEGSEALEYVEQIAEKTGFMTSTLKDAAASLGRGGFKGEDLYRALAAAGDVAVKDTKDHVGALFSTIEKLNMIKARGEINPTRIFGTLGIAEANAPEKFFSILSERTGKGVEQLKKEVTQGKVDASDVLESVYWMIVGKGGKIGTAELAMGKTLGSKLTRFQEIPDLLFESIEKSPAFDKLKDFVGQLNELLGPKGPLGQKIAIALGESFDKIVTSLAKLTPKDISDFVDAMLRLPPAIVKLTTALIGALPMIEQFMGIFGGGSESGGSLSGIKKGEELTRRVAGVAEIGPFIGTEKMIDMEGASPRAKADFDRIMRAKGKGLWANVKALFGVGEEDGSAVADGHARGVTDATPMAVKATEKMSQATVDAGEKKLGIQSPSKVFAQMGRYSVDGFVRGIEDGSGRIDSAISESFGGLASRTVSSQDGARTGRGVSVSLTVTTNVNAHGSGSPNEIAESISSHLETILPGAVQSLFEKMQLQAGA